MWTEEIGKGRGEGMGILLVDADENLRLLVREYLEANGYAVKDAGTAVEALRMAGGWGGGNPKLLLTALRLPDGSGDWLADQLRRRARTGMAVVYMVYDEMSVSVLEGENRHVQKPFSFLQLRKAVAEALENRRTAAAGPRSLPWYPAPWYGYG